MNSVIVSASPVGNVTISNLPDESNVKTKFRTISVRELKNVLLGEMIKDTNML